MSWFPRFAAIVLALSASAMLAEAQPRTARVGMLCPVRCTGPGYAAFEDELRKLGWVEGRNLTIERSASEGRYERLSDLAAELARSRPDVITAAGAPAARAAKTATSEIPIAFSFVAHPVQTGLVQSLARPGGNATGVTAIDAGAFLAKQFEVLRELLPRAQRVAALTNPANDDARLTLAREVAMAAQLGLQVDVVEARDPAEIPDAIMRARAHGAEGLLVFGDAMLNTPPNRIPDLLAQAALPAVYSAPDPVLAGGLISYTADTLAIARRHAQLVDRILRGATPAEIPVEQPTKYNLVVNLRAARAIGLTVPASLVARADEILE